MKGEKNEGVVLRWLGGLGDKRKVEKNRGNSNMGHGTSDSD